MSVRMYQKIEQPGSDTAPMPGCIQLRKRDKTVSCVFHKPYDEGPVQQSPMTVTWELNGEDLRCLVAGVGNVNEAVFGTEEVSLTVETLQKAMAWLQE